MDQPLIITHGANLPHWRRDGATYAVTFRLADSLPASVLKRWLSERRVIVERAEQNGRPLSAHELDRLHQLHNERVEAWLDAGHGSCALREPRNARLVCDAMSHFDGARYELLAWCVMPNHVHAVLTPAKTETLSAILHSWKRFTARQINCANGGSGTFWQKESYDHLVRSAEDMANHTDSHGIQGAYGARLVAR